MTFLKKYPFLSIGLVLVVTGLFILLGTYLWPLPVSDSRVSDTAEVEGAAYELADTVAERTRGLSGRSSVPPDGLLFIFEKEDRHGFWMKDMLIPIDIIWLASDGTILGIENSVEPATYPNVFYPPSPVRYVLETRAGQAHELGWIVGTRLPLP